MPFSMINAVYFNILFQNKTVLDEFVEYLRVEMLTPIHGASFGLNGGSGPPAYYYFGGFTEYSARKIENWLRSRGIREE